MDVPPEVAAVIQKGLAPVTEDRFPDAMTFGAALQRVTYIREAQA